MKRRPADAEDCPGCNTGWIFGDLLCPRCTDKVSAAQPTFYPAWLSARAVMVARKEDTAAIASEAYRRGLIVGTAIILHRHHSAPAQWDPPQLAIRDHTQRRKTPR